MSTSGTLVTMLFIWDLVNPLFVKKAITESGFRGVLKRTRLEAFRADSGEKLKLLMRYETVNECCWEESENCLRESVVGKRLGFGV